MNQRSDRLSPGASSTTSCHCTRRLVLVTVPSFSPDKAEGRKNTSVPMSAGVVSPFCTRRPFCQKFAVSVIAKSRTTIHSSLAKPRSTSSELTAPTAGFWPRMNCPLMTPAAMASVIGSCDTSPVSFGMKS